MNAPELLRLPQACKLLAIGDQLLILYAGDPLALITGDTIEPITTDMSRLFAVLNQLRAA